MYKNFSAEDYRNHLGFAPDYAVDGFIVYGTFRKAPYQQLKDSLIELGIGAEFGLVECAKQTYQDYFEPILELKVKNKRYWFTIAYGGTMLSEWMHLACLWGSQTNIVVGSCGGLLKGAKESELVVPTFAYANESATRMYEPDANCKHQASTELNSKLIKRLGSGYTIWNGPTVTCQAMMGETWEDIVGWSNDGYYGVEMEAATVFAVSNYFKRQSAALLVIGDNLVHEHTVLDVNYEAGSPQRQDIRRDMLKTALAEILAL